MDDFDPLPCHGLTSLFFSFSAEDVEQAQDICMTCPVKMKCLEGAIERKEIYGVWGGEEFNGRRSRRRITRMYTNQLALAPV